MTDRSKWRPSKLPWEPPHYDKDVLYAIRYLQMGKATESQQKLAWDYIMYVSGAGDEFQDLSFRPDELGGERATNFAEGKRFVGMTLRKLLTTHALEAVVPRKKPATK